MKRVEVQNLFLSASTFKSLFDTFVFKFAEEEKVTLINNKGRRSHISSDVVPVGGKNICFHGKISSNRLVKNTGGLCCVSYSVAEAINSDNLIPELSLKIGLKLIEKSLKHPNEDVYISRSCLLALNYILVSNKSSIDVYRGVTIHNGMEMDFNCPLSGIMGPFVSFFLNEFKEKVDIAIRTSRF